MLLVLNSAVTFLDHTTEVLFSLALPARFSTSLEPFYSGDDHITARQSAGTWRQEGNLLVLEVDLLPARTNIQNEAYGQERQERTHRGNRQRWSLRFGRGWWRATQRRSTESQTKRRESRSKQNEKKKKKKKRTNEKDTECAMSAEGATSDSWVGSWVDEAPIGRAESGAVIWPPMR